MNDLSAYNNDRNLHRHAITGEVKIYDSLRGVYLGRLVNIHARGLMIVGDVAMEEDRIYELDMHLPETESEKQVLHVGVDCLWTRSADENGKHWTGFSIIDSSPQSMKDIDNLINRWGVE